MMGEARRANLSGLEKAIFFGMSSPKIRVR